MKVLSLLQPWASLLFIPVPNRWPLTAAKSWETRSWQPSTENKKLIQDEGMLIHASKKWTKQQEKLLEEWPFDEYLGEGFQFPFGAIIGWVKVGEIIPTETWISRHSYYEDGAVEKYAEEYKFGNYGPDRFAWEIKEFKQFAEPINGVKGSLSLWNYEFPDHFHVANKYGGHATFPTPPTKEVLEAVNQMTELAFNNLKKHE